MYVVIQVQQFCVAYKLEQKVEVESPILFTGSTSKTNVIHLNHINNYFKSYLVKLSYGINT